MNAQPDASPLNHGPSLLRALGNAGICVIYCDLDWRVIWSENLPTSFSAGLSAGSNGSTAGHYLAEFFAPDTADAFAQAQHRILAREGSQKLEIRLPGEQGAHWYSLWIDLHHGADKEPVGIITTAVDITDQKHREQTLRTLLREVAHRSKNLLAIIQSIATQTGRYSDTVDGFLARFRGRLQSMASTQDLVTSSNWRGASLDELVFSQVARYTADPTTSIVLQGERPYLNPNAALHIGLALHELAVNSVSYGALARPDGKVEVAMRRVDDPPALLLVWSEAISISDQSVVRKRFGSITLERVVPAALNGSSTLELTSDRLVYSLRLSPDSLQTE